MKILSKLMPLLLALSVITGCSISSNTPVKPPTPPATGEQQKPTGNTNIQTGTVRYQGQIDSNSIEVEMLGVAKESTHQAFRLSETLKAEFASYNLKNGDTLKINYSVNEHGQSVIIKCEVISRTSQNSQSQDKPKSGDITKVDSGRYVGQIDSNSIEIRISGVPDFVSAKAFKLSESLKSNFDSYKLHKDDTIKFIYVPQNERQPLIIQIEKI